jgi:hypothetical protein
MSLSNKACSGSPPGYIPKCNGFDWAFSQPFLHQSDFIPADYRVPEIEPERKILVDEKSGNDLLPPANVAS